VKAARVLAISLATGAGFVLGWYVAGRHLEQHKAALFSPNRFKRLAALSYIAGKNRAETVRVLRDYVAWEPSAALRRRADRVLRRMIAELGARQGALDSLPSRSPTPDVVDQRA
jgi:hypothetical protein